MHKFLQHFQTAIGAAILTILCVILVRSLNIPDLAHKVFFAKETIIDQKKTEQAEKNQKIKTADTYKKHIIKGDQYLLGSYDDLAVTEYTYASNLEPGIVDAYIKIASVHIKNQNYEKALELSKKGYQVDKSNIEIINTYIESAIGADKLDELEGILASNDQTEESKTLYLLGIVYAVQSNYEKSINMFQKAFQLSTDEQLSDNIQIYIDAYAEFDATQSANPNYRKALIAQSLIKTDIYLPTIKMLYDIIKEEYDYRDAWIMLGYSYLKLKNYFDSIEALETALNIDPVKPEIRYFLGLAYFGVENYTDAITNIEIAIENGFQPKVEALQQLGEIAILNQEYEKALEAYKKVIDIKNENIDLYIRPIWLLIEKLDRPIEAVEVAQKAVEYQPENALSYNLLGWAQTATKDFETAYKNLQKAIELDPSLPATYLNLGWWYQLQNQYKEALNYYIQSYKQDPSGPVGNFAAQRYNEIVGGINQTIN